MPEVNDFFEQPILNSPYEYPSLHWELDDEGQPTQRKIASRRPAQYITPIPKPKKRRKAGAQAQLVLEEGKGLSTEEQAYDPTPLINELRVEIDRWRALPRAHWGVTAETARLLDHWRNYWFIEFRSSVRSRRSRPRTGSRK